MKIKINNNINNIKMPEEYDNKIEQIENGTNLLLDEFEKLYLIANTHPNNEEYQTNYQNVIDNLSSMLSKSFTISNDVEVNINKINKQLFNINSLIKQERVKNKELKKKLGIVENKSNAAFEMINDYKDIYDKRYLRNWSLLISSIVCIATITVIYKK